uniref:Uncharacterized protein n=1 Tax=Plectus sambesii TaxID=2011161 RepID=A0A914WIM1_9BILA
MTPLDKDHKPAVALEILSRLGVRFQLSSPTPSPRLRSMPLLNKMDVSRLLRLKIFVLRWQQQWAAPSLHHHLLPAHFDTLCRTAIVTVCCDEQLDNEDNHPQQISYVKQ